MKSPFTAKVTSVAIALIATILVLVPFHAFLTVWGTSFVGHYDALRLWEEVLLVPLFLASCWLLVKDKQLWEKIRTSWLFWLMLAYVMLHILLGAVALVRHQVTPTALGYSLVVNLRLVVFFFCVLVVAGVSDWLRTHWWKLLLIPATLVVIFGLLQALVLPADFLRHFGYSKATIAPYETVDQKLQYLRVQSTLRGANPLGAYLVVVVASLAATLWHRKPNKKMLGIAVVFAASLAVLYFTYSRSAYIGAAVAAMALLWLMTRGRRAKQWLLVGALALALIGSGATLALRHNDHFENTFFHTDEHSKSGTSSNEKRSSALQSGMHDVVHQPLGTGPGTAGPASVYNDHPARFAENYYLQIGQELGWLGLVLFVCITIVLIIHLWQRRADKIAVIMLASLAGITCVNMLSHAWTDDTLAYTWWGFAAIAVAPAILQIQTKAEQNSGSKKTHQKTEKSI